MRAQAQAIFRRTTSQSLLKTSRTTPSFYSRPTHPAARNAKRFLTSEVPSECPVEPVAESPSPFPPSPPPSSPPAEEPERTKTRRTRPFASITPKEPDLPELPDELDILWTPTLDEPADSTSLPPEDILEEALHNLHVALHPQTQNHAVFASPLGPPIEPSIGLYCPIEGGEYVIDATVRELAKRTGAEVLVLDAVQLAAGEWGDFGPAATSLQLPRNPLHFSSSSAPSIVPQSRQTPTSAHDEDEDLSSPYPPMLPQQMMLTFLAPGSGAGPAVVAPSSKRTPPASKVKVFFDALVNFKPKGSTQPMSGKPRLIYIRDYPTLASTSSTWYPHLLSSIRQRRKGAMSRSSSPVPNPMAIIFGMTPPVAPQSTTGGENPAANSAREKRLRSRLKKWEKGEDLLKHEFPRMFPSDEQGDSSSKHDVIVVGSGSSPLSQLAQSLSRPASDSPESQPSLFRASTLVPRVRSPSQERGSRVSRRREINELTMRMGIGAVGGILQPEAADVSFSHSSKLEAINEQDDTLEEDQNKPDSKAAASPDESVRPNMWEDWGNRIETWNKVRRIADRALGSVIAASASEGKPTLDRTLIEWEDVKRAWDSVNGTLDNRRSWLKDALPSSQSAESTENGEEAIKGARDEVIEAVKNDPDLEHHEQRLLSSIVDSASITTTFGQVHLPQHTIDSVRSIVSLPLLHPKAFQHGILKEHSMTGCLLFGPPGTGKTLVVRALAKEAGCRMMVVSPSDVMDMYVGEGEKLVRAVFSLARRLSPCVIFLDEIDALFGARMSARESGSAIAHRGVITEFMQEMDGLKSSKEDNVIVIGATNRPFDLDDAVLRRLPRRLLVDLPGEKERSEILKILLRDETLDPDVDILALAKQTESFSGSDLKHLSVSAALDAVKEHVHLPWAPAAPAGSVGPATSADKQVQSSQVEAKETEATTSSNDIESSGEAADSPQHHSRVLSKRNFDKALKEITPSSSEALGTLAELRKWNDEFGEGRKDRKRRLIWGKGLFGFNDKGEIPKQDEARVSPVSVITRGEHTDA